MRPKSEGEPRIEVVTDFRPAVFSLSRSAGEGSGEGRARERALPVRDLARAAAAPVGPFRLRRLERGHHGTGAALDHLQQYERRTFGAATALLPVPHRCERQLELPREGVLT